MVEVIKGVTWRKNSAWMEWFKERTQEKRKEMKRMNRVVKCTIKFQKTT
jgi:hypothetical protein